MKTNNINGNRAFCITHISQSVDVARARQRLTLVLLSCARASALNRKFPSRKTSNHIHFNGSANRSCRALKTWQFKTKNKLRKDINVMIFIADKTALRIRFRQPASHSIGAHKRASLLTHSPDSLAFNRLRAHLSVSAGGKFSPFSNVCYKRTRSHIITRQRLAHARHLRTRTR